MRLESFAKVVKQQRKNNVEVWENSSSRSFFLFVCFSVSSFSITDTYNGSSILVPEHYMSTTTQFLDPVKPKGLATNVEYRQNVYVDDSYTTND